MNNQPIPPASVLFVDDEEKARKYFALAMAGDFDVKTAGSAAEALELLGQQASQIAIIVSDQRMPGKSGVELLKTVRDYYPHIVRLLTTAYTDLEDAIEAINRGEILRYIQKPWDINTLKAELKQAMHYFQVRHERDNLLEEKLSVKQRMVQIERITHLVLIAQAIPCLRFTGHAIRRYIDQLVSGRSLSSGTSVSDVSPGLDLWSQTLAETARMQEFVQTITKALDGHLPSRTEFTTQLDFPALQRLLQESTGVSAASRQLHLAATVPDPVFAMSVDGPLFGLMLVKLFAVVHSLDSNNPTLAVTISLDAAGTRPAAVVQMAFECMETDFSPLQEILTGPVTGPIPPLCSDLLIVFLVCLHHGGSLKISSQAERGGFVLNLPTNPLLATMAPDPPEWHENILATFEPEIY